MFLHEVGAPDPRFKTLAFHEGMNLLLADKTEESTTGDSRNGAGKSSFVRILRYLMGGSLDSSNPLKAPALAGHMFQALLNLNGTPQRVERPVTPTNRVRVDSRSVSLDEWRAEVSSAFGIPGGVARPTVGELVGQLVRTYFQDATRTTPNDSDLACGIRIGYFLGFSPEVLGKAVEVAALEKHRADLNRVVKAGAIPALSLSEAELRAELAQARDRRRRLEADLTAFRVDEQYAEHQREADRLSGILRDLNDQALALRQRERELQEATNEEQSPTVSVADVNKQLRVLYDEVGVVLPDMVARRFDEVSDFHASVVRNRQMFLRNELQSAVEQLRQVEATIGQVGADRAAVMDLLNQSMALETFRSAQRDVTELDVTITDLEHRLNQVQALTQDGLRLKAMAVEAEDALRTEREEQAVTLDEAMALFHELGEEIYSDREASLLIRPTDKGLLQIVPKIDGDASTGIAEVKTFLLDMVCLVEAIKTGRAPRVLVHDSLLFDSMDDRQMSSCLNIGARFAEQHGFQYIVTLNSDRLEAAEREGFDRRNYVIEPRLTDRGQDGGLFGFRFK